MITHAKGPKAYKQKTTWVLLVFVPWADLHVQKKSLFGIAATWKLMHYAAEGVGHNGILSIAQAAVEEEEEEEEAAFDLFG